MRKNIKELWNGKKTKYYKVHTIYVNSLLSPLVFAAGIQKFIKPSV